eukprot:TRINITY_DN3592_c0_g1_i4.p1 TRINITY_DN3592_c0_g1~~TRINITY_DN3592_c0_g1_i4.p1  ORF type:complete len:696 (+),score=104.90 TRINITY_DN3592_c0_g1_i4:58-2145(+)
MSAAGAFALVVDGDEDQADSAIGGPTDNSYGMITRGSDGRRRILFGICVAGILALGALAGFRVYQPNMGQAIENSNPGFLSLSKFPGLAEETASADSQMRNLFRFWNTYRDQANGLYCDNVKLTDNQVCGKDNNQYSLASVGMGLVMNCIFAEIGLLPKTTAASQSLQTIGSVISKWPRTQRTGFFLHFTNRQFKPNTGEYSTIDSAIGALGAVFAGNYFGGDVKAASLKLARLTKWAAAIRATEAPATNVTQESDDIIDGVPSACMPNIQWGFTQGKNIPEYNNQWGKKMEALAGKNLQQATWNDYQIMYKCNRMNYAQCKDLQFPKSCSRPPCNQCLESDDMIDGVPSACRPNIQWGFTQGKNIPEYNKQWGKNMEALAGKNLQQATWNDYQIMYKCNRMNYDQCKDLQFPKSCSRPPCNRCLDFRMYATASLDGTMQTGVMRPFSEYYVLAYIATKSDLAGETTSAEELEMARRYFDVFFGPHADSAPEGNGDLPVQNNYQGISLLGNRPDRLLPSFVYQFCNFLTKSFGTSPYFEQLFSDAEKADMEFWSRTVANSQSQGNKFAGQIQTRLGKFSEVWGSGAGWTPSGYQASSISENPDLVFSAPIMAGFLLANPKYTAVVVEQLRHLYKEDLCAYEKPLPLGDKAKVLWRCSLKQPNWKAWRAESVDFSTEIFGFAQLYLPDGFYQTYAV